MKKTLLLLFISLLGGVSIANAAEELTPSDFNLGSETALSGSYEGKYIWVGNGDWSSYDYLWIEYSSCSGIINLGIVYNEWQATQSWGDQFDTRTVVIPENSEGGVIGIAIDHTTTYVKGNAETSGEYIGDVYDNHIRTYQIQCQSDPATITINKVYLGSEAEYNAALEGNTPEADPRKDVSSACKTYEPSSTWGWFETGISAPNDYNYFVVELAEASETDVKVLLRDNSTPSNNIHEVTLAAGDLAVKIALDDATKGDIAKIVFQNKDIANFTVSNAFFANDEYMETYTLPVPNVINLSLTNLSSGAADYDADTKTITLSDEKTNKGWWFGTGESAKDFSYYDNLVISFESTTSLGKIVIEYNGSESSSLSFGKGATTVVLPLATDGRKSSVKQIYIQGNAGDTYTLTEAFVALSDFTPPTSFLGVYPLTLSKDKVSFSNPSYVLDFTETDVKAYIVSSISDNAANLELAGEVAANTGVILVGEANVTYDIPVIASTSEIFDDNLLKPGDTTVEESSAYVLSDGKFKLFTGTVIPWGKAYLPKSVVDAAGAHELSLNFGGDATAIKNIKVGTEDNVYYDLQGRRVLYPTKGLYIVNGKKVIVK